MVFKWPSAPMSQAIHDMARNKCQNMTGQWVFEGETFKRWASSSNTFLWIYGIRKYTRGPEDGLIDSYTMKLDVEKPFYGTWFPGR
jgi:hypothetical protein